MEHPSYEPETGWLALFVVCCGLPYGYDPFLLPLSLSLCQEWRPPLCLADSGFTSLTRQMPLRSFIAHSFSSGVVVEIAPGLSTADHLCCCNAQSCFHGEVLSVAIGVDAIETMNMLLDPLPFSADVAPSAPTLTLPRMGVGEMMWLRPVCNSVRDPVLCCRVAIIGTLLDFDLSERPRTDGRVRDSFLLEASASAVRRSGRLQSNMLWELPLIEVNEPPVYYLNFEAAAGTVATFFSWSIVDVGALFAEK
ncbi:hypothetical protein Nepgr_007945 [Nepenthes gracilis]|uniref:Uncharacterized protein n=1 Tax=Nepenthes gracilis TaxID=150966 RepID=A0AAD3XIX7_NEPGR|nr:hypothetical protein Nepgr_007945 [Nepenthes gracilis]